MRLRVLLPCLLAAALASPALAQLPDLRREEQPTPQELERARRQAEAWEAYALRVARALGRSDGARDLALATLLDAGARAPDGDAPAPASAEAVRWRDAATTRGAGDVITQQLLLAAGLASGDQALAAAAARRWQQLAPGNLAPRVLQGLAPEVLLAAAAQSDHNSPDPYPLQRWIASALRPHPPTAADWAAFGEGARPSAQAHAALWASSLAAVLVPDYRGVLGACTGRPLRAPGRTEACRQLSSLLLARPQTVLDEQIGLSLARALSRSAAERAPLDARRRGVDWRQEQMAGLAERGEGGDGEAFARALADPSVQSEDALVRRLLSEARLAQEPPPDWLAPWERRR